MVELVGVHAADETEFVGDPLEVWDRVGEFNPHLTARRPRAAGAEELRSATCESKLLAGQVFGGAILAIVAREHRLVIVEVEVGWRAGEVDHDHPLGLGGQRWQPGRQRICDG